ncbi:MAG: hypothetical protein Kow00124_14640 [Anaerolineae bacterium]
MAQTSPPASTQTSTGARSFLAWVFAAVLIVGGLVFLLLTGGVIRYEGPIEPLVAAGTAALAMPFLVRWLVHRRDWWAAVVAWLFAAIALVVAVMMLRPAHSQIVGMVALAALGVPFFIAYLGRRNAAGGRLHWWPLVPGYLAVALAGLLGLTIFGLSQPIMAAFALLEIALPFWVLYMVNRLKWWALIVAAVFSLLGVGMLAFFSLVSLFRSGSQAFYVIVNIGLALAFIGLWLTVRRFDWALWAAGGFAASAVASVFLPSSASWALLALAMGLYIVYRQVRGPIQAAAARAQAQAAQQAAAQQAARQAKAAAKAQTQPGSQPTAAAQPSPVGAPPTAGPQSIPPRIPASEEAAPQPPRPTPDTRPVVQFRPLDPLAGRKSTTQPEDEDTGRDDSSA